MVKSFMMFVMAGAILVTGVLPVMAYSGFSPTEFPETGGFPTDWLEGEKELIEESCIAALADGVVLKYCQYI